MKALNLSMAILFVWSCAVAAPSDPQYPVSEIPEALKKDVNAVVRVNSIEYKILDEGTATEKVKFVATIFNKNAADLADLYVYYDKLTKVTDISGAIFNEYGKQIKKLKQSEIRDVLAYDGYSLFSDSRMKRANLEQAVYPYTVEFQYEITYKYLFHISGIRFIEDEKIALQKGYYQIDYPTTLAPRYKTYNLDMAPAMFNSSGRESMTWAVENLLPIVVEPLSQVRQLPTILMAPSHFDFDGYKGDMTSWKTFGQWIATLNAGRDDVPEETRQKVRALTKELNTTEEKAKAVYEFVQNRSRYVSIQLGIGGFQPFEASLVDRVGYGDCKALSNYTVALLKEVGVKSHYVLIKAGRDGRPLEEDFPSSQFNHATVCVPNGADTLWLECTSQTSPFAYAGTFTGDRKALAITDDGAKIVNTTRYTATQNLQSRTADVVIDNNGNALASVRTTYGGIQYENEGLQFKLGNPEEEKKWLQENIGIPTFNIKSFTFENRKTKVPVAVARVNLELNRLASVSNKRMFLVANLMNRSTFIPEKVEHRKTTVHLQYAQMDQDTIRYTVPDQLYPESLPTATKISTQFGEYENGYSVDQGRVIYTRRLRMNKGDFPAESYQALIDFFKAVNKADNQKIVFLNKT